MVHAKAKAAVVNNASASGGGTKTTEVKINNQDSVNINEAIQNKGKNLGEVDPRVKINPVQRSNEDEVNLLSDIFKKLNSVHEIKVVFENTPVVIKELKWFESNLEIRKGDRGFIYFLESLPTMSISPDQFTYLSYREHAMTLIKQWNLASPFLFKEFPETCYSPDEDPYTSVGLPLRVILDKCRDGDLNMDFMESVRRLMHICRVVKSEKTPIFGTMEICTFIDGPIRFKCVAAVAQIYCKYFSNMRTCYDEFVTSLPPAYVPKRPSELEMDGAVFREPDSERLISLIPTLGLLAEDLILQLVKMWVDKIAIKTVSQASAETTLGSEMNRDLTRQSTLYRLTAYLNETKVPECMNAVIYTSVMFNAKITYRPNVFSTEISEWIAAFIILLMFPGDILDESTIHSCLMLIVSQTRNLAVRTLEDFSIERLRTLSIFRCLQVRDYKCQVSSITSRVPFVSDPTFRIPFGMDLKGRHVMQEAIAAIPEDAQRSIPKLDQRTILYLSNLSKRFTGQFGVCAEHLIRLTGTFAAGVDTNIKRMDNLNPIILEAKEAFSLLYLFDSVPQYNFIREATFIYNTLGGLSKDASMLITALRSYREFCHMRGASSQQALSYLEKTTEQIYESTKSNEKLRVIVDMIKKKYGKDGIAIIARRSSNTNIPQTILSEIVDVVTNLITQNLSSFGVTTYVILTANPIEDPTARFYGVFQNHDHPFRDPPSNFKRIDYDVFRRMSSQLLANEIKSGLVVNVTLSYKLVIIKSSSNEIRLSDGMYPLQMKEGIPTLVPFTVFAVENGIVSDSYELMKLMAPRFYAYVSVPTNLTHINDLSKLVCSVPTVRKDMIISPYRFEAQMVSDP